MAKENVDQRPKKPLNAYFKFRTEKLAQMRDDADRTRKAKEMWEELDPKIKEQMQNEYKQELEEWRKKNQAWKEAHGDQEKQKKKSKKKKQETDDEDKPKPKKSKPESKKEVKEKEKSAQKERGKSKKNKEGKEGKEGKKEKK